MTGKLKLLFPLLLICLSIPISQAQHQLLMEEKVDDYTEKNWVANKRHYIETRAFYGQGINNPVKYYPLKTMGSSEFELGLRYKLKISPILSTGLGAGYFNQSFRVDTEEKTFPDDNIYDKEVFRVNSLNSKIYLRINIDPKRGNFIGKYFEAGVFGCWSFSQKRIMLTKYNDNEDTGINKSREIHSGLSYIDKIQYGAYLSIGIAGYEVTYRHRLSRIIKEEANDYDFSPNTIGISISLDF